MPLWLVSAGIFSGSSVRLEWFPLIRLIVLVHYSLFGARAINMNEKYKNWTSPWRDVMGRLRHN